MIAAKKGDRISEYILEEPLGRGGFGEVWRARHHLWDDRHVAVKIPTSPEAVRSLANEGLLQSTLSHPGIAEPLGMDTAADPPYFITEFVAGENLRQLLQREGPLPVEMVRSILDAILNVLEYAHSQNVIHQDIKPENIMITPEGQIKLTDFGLGQTLAGESILLSVSLRSNEPSFAGTFPYVAPEIRDGEGDIDARVDLFSLGIVLFELLTGRRPVGGEVPSDFRDDLPTWCDPIFKGLHMRRDKRFATVTEVRQVLVREDDQEIQAVAAVRELVNVVPLESPRDKLLTEREATQRLGLSARELWHWARKGELTPVRYRGRIYFDPSELEDFQRERPTVRLHPSSGAGSNAVSPPPLKSATTPEKALRAPSSSNKARAAKSRLSGPDPAVMLPAGFLPRLIAMCFDLFTLTVILAPIGRPFYLGGIGPITVVLGYFSVCTGMFGCTPGKALLGLRVIRTDRRRLTFLDGVVRSVNYLASLLPLGLGFLVVPFSQRKVAFHDLLCGTQVVFESTRRV